MGRNRKGSRPELESRLIYDTLERQLKWEHKIKDATIAIDHLLGEAMSILQDAGLLRLVDPVESRSAMKRIARIIISKMEPPALRAALQADVEDEKAMLTNWDLLQRRAVHHLETLYGAHRLQELLSLTEKKKTSLRDRISNGGSPNSDVRVRETNHGERRNEIKGKTVKPEEYRGPPGKHCIACVVNGLPDATSHYMRGKKNGIWKTLCPHRWDYNAFGSYIEIDKSLRPRREFSHQGDRRTPKSQNALAHVSNQGGSNPPGSQARAHYVEVRSSSEGSLRTPVDIALADDDKWKVISGCLDTGSDQCFIHKSYMPYAKRVQELATPLKILMANNNGSSICLYKGQVDIRLQLGSKECTVRNVGVFFVDGTWEEFLLGKPFLEFTNMLPEQHFPVETLLDMNDYIGGGDQLMQSSRDVSAAMDEAVFEQVQGDSEITVARCSAVRIESQGIAHSVEEDFENCTYGDNVGKGEALDELSKGLSMQFEKFKAGSGLGEEENVQLSEVVLQHYNAFGQDQRLCQLTNLTPMRVELKSEDIEPCRAAPRALGARQMTFLREKISILVEIGMLIPDPDPTFSSACFVVPKPMVDSFRLVVDMRPLNKLVKRSALPMPNLEAQIGMLSGAKFFGVFDVLSGYDMLRVHPDSQKFFGMATPFGVYRMTGAPMGFINSGQVYSDRIIRECLGDMFMRPHSGVLQWLDDSLVYADTFPEYIAVLAQFLDGMEGRAVRLNVSKCKFGARSAVWCGRHFENGTWRFEDRFYDTILEMPPPRTAADLAQAIYLSNWLLPTIPRATELIQPLRDLLERCYQGKVKRTKKVLVGVPLSEYGWNENHVKAWHDFRTAIAEATRVAIYDPDKILCVLSDASDHFYAACISQIEPEDVDKPLRQQRHQPLFFLSGAFRDNMFNWHISQKEFWPILQALKRFDFMTLVHPTPLKVFCDHFNLQSILRPADNVTKTAWGRLQRWSLALSEFEFDVVQTAGEDNIFADALSRWGSMHRQIATIPRMPKANSVRYDCTDEWMTFTENRLSFLAPTTAATRWEPVNARALRAAQDAAIAARPTLRAGLTIDTARDVFVDQASKRIFIPMELMEKYLVSIHVSHGHPSNTVMERLVGRFYMECSVRDAIARLHRLCLHCDGTTHLQRRKLGEQIHGSTRGEVLHADYLYVTEGEYLLVLTDDLSRKMELFRTLSADSKTVTEALTYWKARYGLAGNCTLVTDGGSHFASGIIAELCSMLRLTHHVTVAYSPWANGSAEVANRSVLRTMKALCSEFRIHPKDWAILLPSILNLLNNTVNATTGLSPNQAYLGKEFEDSILPIVKDGKLSEPRDPAEVRQMVAALATELNTIEKGIKPIREQVREQARKRLNERKGISDIQYQQGDFVRVSTHGVNSRRDKTRLVWTGPYQVTAIRSAFVYEVEDLQGRRRDVHAQRLQFYDDPHFEPTEDIKTQFVFDGAVYELAELKDVRYNARQGTYEVLCAWYGFDAENATWEPVETLRVQVPDLVATFLMEKKELDETARLCYDRFFGGSG